MNETCTSGLNIDRELVCSSCWDVICQDQRYAQIYQRYRNDITNLNNNQELTTEERTEAIAFQRYDAEASFLELVSPRTVSERPRRIREQQSTGEGSTQN